MRRRAIRPARIRVAGFPTGMYSDRTAFRPGRVSAGAYSGRRAAKHFSHVFVRTFSDV